MSLIFQISNKSNLRILGWAEILDIFHYLTISDVYIFGCTSTWGFVNIFLREKNFRKCDTLFSDARLLSHGLSQEKVLLASYPRSGNSFLRRLLEEYTGIITGSDSRSNRTLSASLLRCGYKGEGIVDRSVWVVKSHYPERMGYLKFKANRMILLVRNPFDSIESYFHMGMTNTHDKTLSQEAFESLRPIWDRCVSNEARIWAAYHNYWLNLVDEKIPLLVIRYEDLVSDRKATMAMIIQFLHAGMPPSGWTRFAKKGEMEILKKTVMPYDLDSMALPTDVMHNCINSGSETVQQGVVSSPTAPKLPQFTAGYKPKKGGIGKALLKMSEENIDSVCRQTAPWLRRFGYELSRHSNGGQDSLMDAEMIRPGTITEQRNDEMAARTSTSCGDICVTSSSGVSDVNGKSCSSLDDIGLDDKSRNRARLHIVQIPHDRGGGGGGGEEEEVKPGPRCESSSSSNGSTNGISRNGSVTRSPSEGDNTPIQPKPQPPKKHTVGPSPSTHSSTDPTAYPAASGPASEPPSWVINGSDWLRPADDDFGRRFTDLRRSLTALDTIPFPTND